MKAVNPLSSVRQLHHCKLALLFDSVSDLTTINQTYTKSELSLLEEETNKFFVISLTFLLFSQSELVPRYCNFVYCTVVYNREKKNKISALRTNCHTAEPVPLPM